MRVLRSLLLGLLALAWATSPAAQPISLHPENPHYFLFRGDPTVLVTSGEHYGGVMNLDFDFETYFATLADDGLNLTRLFTGVYVEGWGEPWNTLNPAPERFIAPWARSDTPGYADGGNKFDLDRWDPAYFERLRDFVAEADRHGIVVEVVLFCVHYNDETWALAPINAANNVNGIGTGDRHAPFNETDPAMMQVQEELVRKIVRELRASDNVYFELANEPYWDEGPALGDPWNDRIVDAIRAESPDHLIALNVANDSARVDSIHPEIGILNFHYAHPPNAVAMNYDHPRVIGDDETGFDGPHDAAYRIEGWSFMLAGGGVYSNLDWSFTVDAEDGTSTAAEDRLGGGSPALRRQLGYLKRFLDGFEFIRMRPANHLIEGGTMEGGAVHVLAEVGQAYAIYLHGGQDDAELQTDLHVKLPQGAYDVEWIDTKKDTTVRSELLAHAGGTALLSSPTFDTDIALRIRRRP